MKEGFSPQERPQRKGPDSAPQAKEEAVTVLERAEQQFPLFEEEMKQRVQETVRTLESLERDGKVDPKDAGSYQEALNKLEEFYTGLVPQFGHQPPKGFEDLVALTLTTYNPEILRDAFTDLDEFHSHKQRVEGLRKTFLEKREYLGGVIGDWSAHRNRLLNPGKGY